VFLKFRLQVVTSLAWARNLLLPDPRIEDSGQELAEITEIRERALVRTDISDHLVPLFVESFAIHPRLIVELGVRTGESTFVLERVARLCGSTLVSVDVDDCGCSSSWTDWTFVKSDDIEFARQFPEWCRVRGIRPEIDVLFVDTSHEYEHTVKEIAHWFPLLSQRAKVFFHDTNLRRIYFRQDGSMGIGWDGRRGVMAAVEEYLGAKFNETRNFTDSRKGWIIRHNALCSGFTILERLSSTNGTGAPPRD
jgi:cephalosporin hydroxylase